MFITLQDTDGSYESTLGTMHDVLPEAMFEFLAPRGTEWDAPVVGEAFSTPPIPGPDVYNLRARRAGQSTLPLPERPPRIKLPTSNFQLPSVIAANVDFLGVGSWIWELPTARSCRQQQLGRRRRADRRWRRDCRQRHASGHPRAEHVVPRLDGMAGSANRRSRIASSA